MLASNMVMNAFVGMCTPHMEKLLRVSVITHAALVKECVEEGGG